MSQKRRNITNKMKAKIALEAIRNEKTTAQIVSEYKVQNSQVSNWKTKVIESLPEIFEDKRSKESRAKDVEKRENEFHSLIGKMQFEIEFLKKKSIQLGL